MLGLYPGNLSRNIFRNLHKVVLGNFPWTYCAWENSLILSKIRHTFLVCFCFELCRDNLVGENVGNDIGTSSWASSLEVSLGNSPDSNDKFDPFSPN